MEGGEGKKRANRVNQANEHANLLQLKNTEREREACRCGRWHRIRIHKMHKTVKSIFLACTLTFFSFIFNLFLIIPVK